GGEVGVAGDVGGEVGETGLGFDLGIELRGARAEVEVLRVPAGDSGVVQRHIEQSVHARGSHFAVAGGADVGCGDCVPVAGGRWRADSVGPFVDGGELVAGEVIDGVLDFGQLGLHLSR